AGTLTFLPADTTKTVTVKVCGRSEERRVGKDSSDLSTATNATISDASGLGTITNDDTVTLAIDDVAHNEGNSGTTNYVFTVTKTGATDLTTTVDFATTAGSGTTAAATCAAGVDYETQAGTLTFLPADTTKTVTVKVCGDATYENTETFTVDLSTATNATISDASGLGTITNDDTVTLAIDDVAHNEGNSGTTNYVFTVTKTGATDLTTTVDFATTAGSGTTAAATCAAGPTHRSSERTLTFLPADTTKTVTVKVCGDATYENTET